MKTTKEIIEKFYQGMLAKQGWEDFLAEHATYLGPLSPLLDGKAAVVEGTKQFLKNKYAGEVKNIIVDEDSACVLTAYQLGHPDAALLDLKASEIIKVEDGKVVSMEVYFDTLKLTAFFEKMQSMQPQQ